MISHDYAMMYSRLGRMGIVVVMLLTSILLLGFGLLAIRLRKVLMGSVTEATGSIIQRFTAPSSHGGGSSSTSVSTGGAGGNGGSGGGAVGGAASSALSSTASGAGSMIGRGVGAAVLGGGSVAAGMKLLNGKGSEHSSVATGDGDTSVANAQAGDVNATMDGTGTSSNTANANLNNAQSNASAMGADGIATSAAIMSGAMADGAATDRSERDAGMALMESDSLASATSSESGMRNAQAGEAGPAHSNCSMQDAIANSNATSGDMRGVNADATGIGANGTNGVGAGAAGANGVGYGADGYGADGYGADGAAGYGADGAAGYGAAGANGYGANGKGYGANGVNGSVGRNTVANNNVHGISTSDAIVSEGYEESTRTLNGGYRQSAGANGVNGAAGQAGRGVSMMGAAADARAMSAQNVNANANAQGRMNAYRQGSVGVENRSVVAGRNDVNGMADGNGYGVGAAGANGINGVHGGNGMAGSYRAVGGSVGATGRGVVGMNGGNGMAGRSGMSGAAGRNGAAGMAGMAGRNGSAGMNGAGGYRVNNTQNQTNVAGNRYAMPSTPNINVANAARGGNSSQRGYMPPRNTNRQMSNPMNSLPNEDTMPTGPVRGVGSINSIRTNAGGQVGGRGSYGRVQQQQGAYKNTAGTNDFV